MSWIIDKLKRRANDYLLKQMGDDALFDQEETFEIKKRNEYYEMRDEKLNQLSTPAPVVGDISSMTDIAPAVRLPRIPYYEYIYYLMRWNSSVLRMIAMKIKQEVFRETRLHGLDWEGKFKVKCDECGTEFEEQLEECEFCHSKNVSPPDVTQKKLLEPFLKEANFAEQTLLEVFEEEEDDLNTVDDCYLVFVKDYFVGPGGLFGKVTEIMRGDPSRFRIVSDISGRRGGKWWICPAHRNSPVKPVDYNDNPLCEICRLPLQDVHYVETTTGGVTPAKYYIKGEVVHSSKYEPSRLYGIPAMFSVYIIARTIQLMDLYTEELYEKGRIKGIFGVPTDNVTELRKWWDETTDRLRTDPHYIPIVGITAGPDGNRGSRIEFVKLIDNMDELKFQEHRRMLKEEIAGLFGVNLVFLADTSASGGLNNEGLQITVTDRTVEWGQSIYHDQFFPKILEALNITDWIIKLKPSKETDEMAELERFDLRVKTAGDLQQMGYELDLKNNKFEIRGKAYIVDGPINAFGGGFGNTDSTSSNTRSNQSSADTQAGKPEKAKPAKELKRMHTGLFDTKMGEAAAEEALINLNKAQCRGRIPTTKGFHPYYCPSEKMTFEFFVDSEGQAWYIGAKDEDNKDVSRWVTLGNAKTAFGWYGQDVKDGRGKIMKSLEKAIPREFHANVNSIGQRMRLWGKLNDYALRRVKQKLWQQYGTDLFEKYRLNEQKKIIEDALENVSSGTIKSDDFPGQDISPELQAEIEAHLDQAFSNPDNFVYVDIPDSAKASTFRSGAPRIQAFDMERVNDESGQSGTGIVLSGIVFQDGKVVIRWNTENASTTVFDSWEDFEAIHISKHPGNDTKIYFYELTEGDMKDFAKAVVEPGKKVLADYKQIEHNFAKQLEEIYLQKLAKKIEKLDDKSANRLNKEIDSIVEEATPLIEKIAFSEVLRAYKKGKSIDESRKSNKLAKTIDLPDNLTEPFRAEYGAFGLDKDDWQVLRAIYRRNPFWKAFTGMSQSVSDKLKEHITESYEAPNSSRMKATIRDVEREYPDIGKERAQVIAYGRIGKFSLPKVLTMMKRTINTETYRLERIARTETTAITSKGREMQFRQTDPESLHKYDWFGPNDKRNSDECPLIKSIVKKEGKGRGVSLDRLLEIQEEVVNKANSMRKTDWKYRDWLPHANCRHGLRRIV